MYIQNVFDRAAQEPEDVAIVDPQGRTWTRAEIVGRVNRMARGLRRQGLRPGDALVVVSPNCSDYVCVCLAAQQIGLYFVPLNWHLSLDEITYVIASCDAKAVVIHERHFDTVDSALIGAGLSPLRVVIGTAAETHSVESLIAGESDSSLESPVIGRVMQFTAATTGRPKGIVRPLSGSEAALNRLLEFGQRLNRQAGIPDSRAGAHLCQSMLYHGAPLDCVVAAIHLGQRVVLMDGWRPEEALKLIQSHQVATTLMVPAMFVRLCKLPEVVRRRYSVESLKMVSHGGAFCSIELKRQMIEWWGPVFTEIYGMSEGPGAGITSQEWLRKPGSVGRAHPGADIKILDDQGAELPVGTEGGIYIKPYGGDRFEYLGDEEKTRSAYRGDYFTAGDIGYLDSDGYLYICDRRQDLILTGGTNVYPAEVERVLLLHPNVADCAVFGIPDQILGQRVVAVIELLPPAQADAALRADVMQFIVRRIAPSKVPANIEFTTTLLRDPAGKLSRRKVHAEYLAGRPDDEIQASAIPRIL